MKNKKKEINSILVNVLLKIMLAISVGLIGLLAYYSMTGTFLRRGYMNLDNLYVADGFAKNLLYSGLLVSVLVIAAKIFNRKVIYKERVASFTLAVSSVLLFVIGFVYLKDHPYYMDGDQINTFYGAVYATMKGSDVQYLMFKPGGYLGIYPQQKGLVVFYMILYKIFGDNAFICTQYLHLLYPQIVLYSGCSILKEEKISPFARMIFCIFVLGCIPMYLYLPYMYGDLGSIAFSFVAALSLVRLEKYGRLYDVVWLCASCTMALLLRKQIWILIAAILIVLILDSIRNSNMKIAIVGLCVILSGWGTFFCIEKYFESASGYGHVDGVPSVCWLVMGLQETNGQPGIYNRYNQGTFEDNGFDAGLASEVAKNDLKERIAFLKDNPAYARFFFASKIRQEWTAPDFEALRSTSVWKAESGRDPLNPPGWLLSLYTGQRYAQVMALANIYQSIVYICSALLALILLIRKGQKLPVSVQFSLIYTLGGLLFFAVWENQSRYVFPFFVSLILIIPRFIDEISAFPLVFAAKKG